MKFIANASHLHGYHSSNYILFYLTIIVLLLINWAISNYGNNFCFRLCYSTLLQRRTRIKQHWEDWWSEDSSSPKNVMLLLPDKLKSLSSGTTRDLIFANHITQGEAVYTHTTHAIHSMPETVAHRILRSSKHPANQLVKFPRVVTSVKNELGEEPKVPLLPEHPHYPRPVITRYFQRTVFPAFLSDNIPKVSY